MRRTEWSAGIFARNEREARRLMGAASEHQEPRGWHSRGYLPHFDAGEIFQSVTLRLHDSMPQNVIAYAEPRSCSGGTVRRTFVVQHHAFD
jgi:hypothetical protein